MSRILILEPQTGVRTQLGEWLERNGHSVLTAAAVPADLDPAGDLRAIVACAGLAEEILASAPAVPVLLYSPAPELAEAVRLMRQGAEDYLPRPTVAEELIVPLEAALERHAPHAAGAFSLSGSSAPMRELADNVAKVAPTESTVLISGETGTGKELVARALHAASKRRLAPMIAINCATIPSQLIEAEIFGHDAESGSQGLLDAADSGTLFLDEIGELPLDVQARLLKVLEERSVNVRLIAATQRDLKALIETGQFRRDLYYRLNVVSLHIPPLRERGSDTLTLAREILARTASRLGKPQPEFSEEACDAMVRYRWPGNVRELENAIERAVILGGDEPISSELLAIKADTPARQANKQLAPDQTMEDYFVSFVTAHQDSLTETELAERLGISRKSLWERRQRLNIPRKKTRKRGPRRDVS